MRNKGVGPRAHFNSNHCAIEPSKEASSDGFVRSMSGQQVSSERNSGQNIPSGMPLLSCRLPG